MFQTNEKKNLLGDVVTYKNGCKNGIMLTNCSTPGCYKAKQCEVFGRKKPTYTKILNCISYDIWGNGI